MVQVVLWLFRVEDVIFSVVAICHVILVLFLSFSLSECRFANETIDSEIPVQLQTSRYTFQLVHNTDSCCICCGVHTAFRLENLHDQGTARTHQHRARGELRLETYLGKAH